MNKAASQRDSATCKYYKSSWIVMIRGKQVFVRQRLKDMGFKPVQNIIKTSKGQTNESPFGSEWLTLCNNLGPRQQQNGKVPAFIGFSELQSPAVSTGPKVQELFVFFFPFVLPTFFTPLAKSKMFSILPPPSLCTAHSLTHRKCMVVYYKATIVRKHFLICCIFHVLVARFVFSMNNKSKSQE